jgi:acyl-CoA synthetase (AMP-forming)/AMP-acid ligase II
MDMLPRSGGELLAHLRTLEPARSAVVLYDTQGRTIAVSYQALVAAIDNINAHVEAEWQPHDRPRAIGILLRNHPYYPALLAALLASDCLVVPMNPDGFPAELQYIAGHARLDLVITDEESPHIPLACPLVRIDDLLDSRSASSSLLRPRTSSSAPALVMYTSGTTSAPKGVMLSEASVFHNAGLIARHFALYQTTQLTTLPMYHAHAFHFGAMSSLLTGGTVVVLRRFDPLLWSEAVKVHRVTWTSVVPSLLPLLVCTDVHKRTSTLQGVLVSSAPIIEPLARAFETQTEIPIIQGWGQTEYTCWATVCDRGGSRMQFDGERRSVGPALAGVTVEVLGDDGVAAGAGIEGDLYLRGPSTMVGYLGSEELTSATLTVYGLKTGDRGYWKTIGGKPCYFVTGRIKDVINKGGDKLSPIAIEAAIEHRFPNCTGAIAIVGFEHQLFGEEVGLVVDTTPFDNGTLDKHEFIEFVSTMHHAYRPRVVMMCRSPIDRTFTGKVQRGKLKARFAPYGSVTSSCHVVEVP